jgi:hypothetical protein
MYRVTARVLLVLLLGSVSAPAAVAISSSDPHACCIRKNHRLFGQTELLNVRECCRGGGCRLPLAVFLWAGVPPRATFFVAPFRVTVQSERDPIRRIKHRNSAHAVRGPPLFFAA